MNYKLLKENSFKMGTDNNKITIIQNSCTKMNFIYKRLYIPKGNSFKKGNGLQ